MAEKKGLFSKAGKLSAPEMRPQPRSRLAGLIADAMIGARDFADRARVPESVPLLGGQGVGSLFLGRAPEEVNELSYGNSPFQINPYAGRTGSYVPEMKRGRGAQVFDALSLLPVPGARTVAGGLFGVVPGADSAMFIGPKAKTWDAAAAARALELEQAGVPAPSIWSETGTFRGADGKWRQEISDDAAKVRDYNYTPQQALKSAQLQAMITGQDAGATSAMIPYASKTKNQLLAEYKRTGGEIADAAMAGDRDRALQLSADRAGLDDLFGAMRNRPYGPMSAYLSHGDLGAAYPDVYRMHTRITDDISPALGEYVRGTDQIGEQIRLANKPQWSGDKTIPLHELQHAIQAREGFARGGNPRSAADDVGQELLKASERIRKIEADPSLFEGRKAIDEAFDASINGRITNDEFYKIVAQHPIVAEYSKLQSFRRDAPRDGDEAYRRLAGEAEARATQARMNMTPAQRRAMFPYESYDVPLNQLIVRQGGGAQVMNPIYREPMGDTLADTIR